MRNSGDAQQIEIGWWPGGGRYPRPAFFGFISPAAPGFPDQRMEPPAARWDPELGEYLFDWDDVIAGPDPHASAVAFGRSVLAHACGVCDWDPDLAGSLKGSPPPLR